MPKTSQHRLTKRSVDALGSREKDYLVWDRDLPGFGVRVLVSGRKVFVVQARGPSGSKRRSIARHGRMPVAEARRRAAVLIDRIKQGADPNPAAVPGEPTVAELADRFMRVHVVVNCKASTAQLYRGVIDNHIVPALGERRIGDVKRADVAALHYALRDKPGMANITLQVLSQLFYKAEQWRLIGPRRSPCRSIPKYRLRSRERYLTGEEYRRLMTLKSTWRRVRRIAGLQGVRLHDLCHSYASRALAAGESLSTIGELLNHAQVQTTARYAHLMRGAERAAAARVGDSIARHMDAHGAGSAQPAHGVREVR